MNRRTHVLLRVIPICELCCMVSFVVALCVAVIAQAENPAVLSRQPMLSDRDQPSVDVRIGDRTPRCMIDTGSSLSVFSPRYSDIATRPAGEEFVRSFDRTVRYKFYSLDSVLIGGFSSGPTMCYIKTDEGADPWNDTGQFIVGLLGSSALRSAILQIDYQEKESRILASHSSDPQDRICSLRFMADCPGVMTTLDKYRLLLIDTGNPYGLTLPSDAVDELVRRKDAIRLPLAKRLIKKSGQPMFILRELKLGEVVLSDVIGVEGRFSTIGNQVLSRFRVTIDYPNKKLYLKPRTDLPPRDPLFGGGVFFRRNEQGTFVRDLEIDRPAHQAGLQIDDRIIKVDGKAVEKMPFPELYDLLARHEVTVPIEFERDQKPQSVEVRLQQPLAWPEKKPLRKIPDE